MTEQSTKFLAESLPTQHPSVRFFATFLVLSAFLLLPHLCTSVRGQPAGPWPQWRGDQGLGISKEPSLPLEWSENSPNIRWKTNIPGEGVSSPIVSNDRVILTTAYESSGAATLLSTVRYFGILCVIGLLAVLCIGTVRATIGRKRTGEPHRWSDIAVTTLSTILCVDLAFLVTVSRSNAQTLFVQIGHLFARLGMPDMEHLCSMQEGVLAAIWLTSGSIALLGLAVVPAWLRRGSAWRLIALLVTVACIVLAIAYTPLDQWTEKTEWWERLIFTLPAIMLTLWHSFRWIQTIRSIRREPLGDQAAESSDAGEEPESHSMWSAIWDPGPRWSVGVAVSIILLALLVFVPPNFIQPRLGLQRAVVCLDFNSGKILWNRPVFSAPAERIHSDNTYATPTAVTDGRLILVKFGVGVACLDYEGRVVWKQPDFGFVSNSRYGAANSPVLVGDKVILVHQHELRSRRPTLIIAYDKATGDESWRISPNDVHGCYGTPLIYEVGGVRQLIIPSWQMLSSYDADSGRLLWSVKLTTEQLVASPARSDSLLCIAGSTWGQSATIMLELDDSDPSTAPEILWRSNLPVGNCSPVIYKEMLFTLTDSGTMTCYNAVTGDILWEKRLRGSRYLSSILAGCDRIYASNIKGLTTVLAAEPKVKILSQNQLSGRLYASPAAANGCILLRVGEYLYRIEAPP